MNKKFSTFVAGALLAGAVVTPQDLLAEIALGASPADATVVTTSGATTNGFMVLNVNGKKYVVTSDVNHAMIATPFEEAFLSSSEMKFTSDGTNMTITVNGNTIGFASASEGWGEEPIVIANSAFSNRLSIANTSHSVKVAIDPITGRPVFTPEDNTNNWFECSGCDIKIYNENSLNAVFAENFIGDNDLNEFVFGKYYILMNADGQYLKAVSSGAEGYVSAEPVADLDEDDPAFYWTVGKQGALNKAAFTSKDGGLLVSTGTTVLYAGLDNDKKGLVSTNGEVALTDESGTPSSLSSVYIANVSLYPISSSELQSIYGSSFAATISRNNKGLDNNPFTGSLTPVQWKNLSVNADLIPLAGSQDQFMLQNGEGKVIVVQTDDKYAAATDNYGYKVLALDPKDLATAIKANSTKYVYNFSIYADPLFTAGTNEEISFITATTSNGTSYKLGSIALDSDDNQTLAAEVMGTDYLDAIKIKLSKANLINLKEVLKTPTFFTIKNVNTKAKYAAGTTGVNFGKVLGLDEDGNVAFMKKDEVLLDHPETQWAITIENGQMVIKNRENTVAKDAENTNNDFTLDPNQLYVVPGKANTYAWIKGGSLTKVDTLEIAPVVTSVEDGFARFDANAVKDQLFYIGSYSDVKGVSYVAESHKNNHQLGLVAEEKEATEWRLGALTYEENDAWDKPVSYTADTIRIESALGYWDADAKTFKNTKDDDSAANNSYLKILVYSLKNSANDEYVKYDDVAARNRYATGLEGEKDGFKKLTDAQYFAVKVAGEDLYNLIPVTYVDGTTADGYADGTYNTVTKETEAYEVKTSLSNHKVFAGNSASKGILAQTSIYDRTENDLFTIKQKDAPAYLKLKQGQIIKLYREEYTSESNVLYEKDNFLGVGNAVENTKINPALYVDTVYVDREGNNRWEYLLGVNITRIDTTYKCDEPSHSHLIHRADTTKGRFLVNFADSAIVAAGKEDVHVNKYMYSDSRGDWAKLGFVPGFRTADVLSIWNGEKGKADLIEVGTAAPQLVKFAFRIVDSAKNAFVIETGYKDLNVKDYDDATIERAGYLRYDNGVVYVTDDIEDAEVFMANPDEDRTPTANDEIAAEGVSVVAGNGTVTVKDAEGKNVVITNVLGQTIANTVITSSEATISAPAGIVVVAVEGEAAVKAIVK
ncbi:DUF6383 domain-containing protein [Parabacteroides chongii]|uniref:DUF6383 domain-containing protein n=1 Tax=Parabacteroides chongii TaxID=2685834 RepID=UPI00240D160D|nr:DUF6383 domain-containing protein [Parabacteroides chongii]WFE86417.1 DUF6383 domain-containing protein [Parabacteroides chongii]